MPRVLVIDDDDTLRYATAKLLAEAGYDVVDAPDYRDGLRLLEDGFTVHLLIVDIGLPMVHGFALARMARMKQRDIKCIYISGHDVPTTEAVGPVLRKPIDHAQLLAEVATALRA